MNRDSDLISKCIEFVRGENVEFVRGENGSVLFDHFLQTYNKHA